MKCKICGAELKKKGEICNKCMNKLLQEQEVRNDKSPVFTFESKFVLGYELLKHCEQLGIALFAVALVICVDSSYWKYAILGFLLFVIWGILYLLKIKLQRNSVSCNVYRTKFVITTGIIRRKRVEIPFSEIAEVSYSQGNIHQLFNTGDIVIRRETRDLLHRFVYVESVRNITEVFEKIKEVYNG